MRPGSRGRLGREAAEHEPTHRAPAGAVLAAALAAGLAVAVATIPREHAPLPAIARYALTVALPVWKLAEPVNEIVYGTRGFDTFGETFLLLAAVVSVIVLTRSREPRRGYFGEERAGAREQATTDPAGVQNPEEAEARQAEQIEQGEESGVFRHPETPDTTPIGTPAPETAEAMTIVVRTAVRVALPILAVAGLYVVAYGYSPGGGFPGGAVIAGVVLLAYAAFGRRRIAKVVRPEVVEVVELGGAAAIILIEALGLFLKGSFTANWLPLEPAQTIRSGGIAQLFSGTELIEVATGLTIVIFALIGMRHDWSPDDPGESAESGGNRGSAQDREEERSGRR